MVTLYHWDLPQRLQDIGGWTNPILADYFEDYAYIMFSAFGNKVKWWITINEPFEVIMGYGSDTYAPALNLNGVGEYLAAHTLIKAHARAYRLYEKHFKPQQKFGLFGHPIYSSTGDYPTVIRDYVDRNSASEGRMRSPPVFTREEIKFIKGTYDFFGLNHYTSHLCTTGKMGKNPSLYLDSKIQLSDDPKWPSTGASWNKVVPEGFRGVLNWIKKEYGNQHVFITENGYSDNTTMVKTDDKERIDYYNAYLSEMLKAINVDGCKVIGFTVWSLMDNFEWRDGYTQKFGIYEVDFSSPNRTRIPRASVEYFKELIAANS